MYKLSFTGSILWDLVIFVSLIISGLVFRLILVSLIRFLFAYIPKERFLILKYFQSPIQNFILPFYYLMGLNLLNFKRASLNIQIGDSNSLDILEFILKLWLGIVAIFFVRPFLMILVDQIKKHLTSQKDPLYNQLFLVIKKILNISIFVIGALVVIQNMGYNVTSIVAGLGIGGLAVALAAQESISNIFGSLVILFDRPFVVGDWISFNGTEGTVESIGFRSTRIKTFYDSIIVIPNSTLSNSTIDNLGKRQFRRTRFTLGLVYSTPSEKIEAFIEGIKKIIQEYPLTKKDYYQVSFSGYGDSSLNIFVNLFLKVRNWDEELKSKQDIYFKILKLSQSVGVEFAFPSRSLYVEKTSSPPNEKLLKN